MNVPFRDLLPMVHPNDIVFDGMKNKKSLFSLRNTKGVRVRVSVCRWTLESIFKVRVQDISPQALQKVKTEMCSCLVF